MQHTPNIIELLKETAFPQMLLIDGSWGCGKTHYIKNELIVALKGAFQNHQLHYFSLYGVSSISDFRDRLISLTLTDNSETTNFIQKATQVVEGIATNMGERGIGGILNGAAGAYKYKLYSDLDNYILVLDDLERVSNDKTIRDILGECLNLAENKNIKVIVVANESKLSCKDDIEKVFIDKVKFGYTPKIVAEILRDEFSGELSDSLFNELILHINSLGSTNIRVLKRALIKFKKLKEIISSVQDVSLEISLSRVLRQVIKICYARFEKGYSSKEIKSSAKTRMSRLLTRNDASPNSLDEKEVGLGSILGSDISHEYLVDFCCDGIFLFGDVAAELKLPIEKRLIDKVLDDSLLHKLTEDQLINGVRLLTELINKDSNIEINEWFRSCDTLIYLIEQKYTSHELSREEIINICSDKKIDCFATDNIPDRGSWGGFYIPEIHKLYNTKLAAVRESIQLSDSKDFTALFLTSWLAIEEEVYQKLSHKPFLQNVGINELVRAINNWSPSDVYRFSGYMREKYNFSNIEDFFEPEHATIQASIEELDKLNVEPSLKHGTIVGLKKTLTNINNQMIERLEKKGG